MCKVKTCSKCGDSKPLSEFVKCNDCDLGVRPECKTCKKKLDNTYRKKYYEKNKEIIAKKKREKIITNRVLIDLKKEKKLQILINELVGVEYGSFKVVKFDCREKRGKSKYERNYFIKECRFCGEQKSLTSTNINTQIKNKTTCNLCNESVKVKTKEKKCNSCSRWLPGTTEYFTASKNRRWGIHYYCRECDLEKGRKFRENPDNRAKEYEQKKKRLKEDSLFRFKCRVTTNIKNSLKARGFKKNSKASEILGCSKDEFINYISNKFSKGMTWDNHGDWHLDHQIPVSIGETEEEIMELCHHSNYQPLWCDTNLSKGNKIFIENINEENKVRFGKFIERYNKK